jgi:hypothetical protein
LAALAVCVIVTAGVEQEEVGIGFGVGVVLAEDALPPQPTIAAKRGAIAKR